MARLLPLRTFKAHSESRSAYLLGLMDRQKGREYRADYMPGSDCYVAYVNGWRDVKPSPRVAKPAPLPSWLSDLIAAEDEAREGRAA
jgi:hypothetical protein